MKVIQPENQPKPKGHYSPGIRHKGVIYVSGQLPMDLETREPFAGDIETQTELALRNVEATIARRERSFRSRTCILIQRSRYRR